MFIEKPNVVSPHPPFVESGSQIRQLLHVLWRDNFRLATCLRYLKGDSRQGFKIQRAYGRFFDCSTGHGDTVTLHKTDVFIAHGVYHLGREVWAGHQDRAWEYGDAFEGHPHRWYVEGAENGA